MNEKQFKATRSVLKKLSAMRKTLAKTERETLDSLILRQAAEVTGHAMLVGAVHADSAKVDSAKVDSAKADAAHVSAASVDAHLGDIMLTKDGYVLS